MTRTRPFLADLVHHQDPDDPRHGRRVGADYQPDDAALRAARHQPGTAGPGGWPVRLTRCGEHPGRWGDVERCGDHAPWPRHPSRGCVHPAGHFPGTWHRSPNGVEWDYSDSRIAHRLATADAR